ncbi:hypothetical protein NIES37_31720 [Tolypothrix tenuis PCC 7101]|uniref:Uncharacterized protein n=1 Tax=Tolypothrix tenuis PCC 7101 TaxID=231146 RepID=A0A1Z4N0F1_9CYAN|nr:hypothetical protein [Aulosira sp. FACHB-113]BAY99193.1 hypothetical protein NIES37_31720 [Tolypothrix tenuis PCC 7101]BAZ76884.1 hypothetical protein NIES50_54860 [Aulosira laxa NIES-50]
MLVFFIHGVAESKVKFAQDLKHLIKDELSQRGKDFPYFHSGFYADVLNKKDKIWNCIDRDLKDLKSQNPNVNLQDIFRGQEIRREFISDFVGDAFTYLNPERGAKIREAIAGHLEDFVNNHPEDKDLHIVAHSMGTVILWDILFSDKFQPGDAAFKFRSLILETVKIKSIITMGSPIVLFNMMLDINPEHVNKFALLFHQQPIRWTNIIHSSDLIAYPISSSLKINGVSNLSVQDKFISTGANDLEKTVRGLAEFPAIEAASKVNPKINQAFSLAAIASGAGDGHTNYWKCTQTAKIIVDNMLGDEEKIIDIVIERLKKVSGMTITLLEDTESAHKTDPKMDKAWEQYFGKVDKLKEHFYFADGSGKLRMRDNIAQIPHVSVYNELGNCQFKGYVGLVHANGLRQEVEAIKQKYC